VPEAMPHTALEKWPHADASTHRDPAVSWSSLLPAALSGAKWRITATVLLIAVAGEAAYLVLPRQYESTALVLLRPTDREGQADTDTSARLPMDENGIQSEIDLLSSPAMTTKVVESLHLDGDPEFNPVLRSANALARAAKGARGFLRRSLDLPLGQMEAQEDGPEARRLLVAQRVRDRLSVRRERRSYLLRVSYRSENAAKAAAMANALVRSYLDAQLDRKRFSQHRLTEWLELRVTELQGRVTNSTHALEEYLLSSGLVDTGEQASLQQQLITLSTEVAAAHSRFVEAQTQAREFADLQRAGALESAPEVLRSTLIQNLRERIITLAANVGSVPGGLPSAPQQALNDLRQAIAAEASRYLRGAQAEAVKAQQREEELRKEIARLNAAIARRQSAEWRLDTLRREAAADRAALEEATKRWLPHIGRAAVLQPDGEVVAPAQPSLRPATPNGLGVLGGTLGMVVLAACLIAAAALRRLRRELPLDPSQLRAEPERPAPSAQQPGRRVMTPAVGQALLLAMLLGGADAGVGASEWGPEFLGVRLRGHQGAQVSCGGASDGRLPQIEQEH
jgi:polysaccharide biosynthesis transport protein